METRSALSRQISYTGLSLVFYEPVRNFVAGGTPLDDLSFGWRLWPGHSWQGPATWSTPQMLSERPDANSVEKLQIAQLSSASMPRMGFSDSGPGCSPTLPVVSLEMLARGSRCYDQAKMFIIKNESIPIEEGKMAHFAAASVAGLMSALASCPVDVVRTRLFNQAGRDAQYKGTFDALAIYPEGRVLWLCTRVSCHFSPERCCGPCCFS